MNVINVYRCRVLKVGLTFYTDSNKAKKSCLHVCCIFEGYTQSGTKMRGGGVNKGIW